MCVWVCVCVYVCNICVYGIRKGPRRREISSKGKTFIDLLWSFSFCLSLSFYLSLSLSHTHTSSLYVFPHFSLFSLSLSLSLSVRSCPRVSSIFIHTLEVLLLLFLSLLAPNSRDSRRPFTNHRYTPNPIAQLYMYIYIHTPQVFPYRIFHRVGQFPFPGLNPTPSATRLLPLHAPPLRSPLSCTL